MIKQKIILIVAFILGIFPEVFAQKTYTITFNESGQITGAMPALITSKDCIKFEVVGTRDAYEVRVLQAYTRYLETIKNLDKNEGRKYKVLAQIDLDESDFQQLLFGVQLKMAQSLLDWIAKPDIYKILEKKRNIGEDKDKLKTYTTRPEAVALDVSTLASLNILAPEKMVNPEYVVEYSYKSVSNPDHIDCLEPLELDANEKECLWIFKSKSVGPFTSELGFFRLSYQLHLRNNLYKVLNEQLKSIAWLISKTRVIDLDVEKKNFQAGVKIINGLAPVNDKLFKWLDSRLKGVEDKTDLTLLKNTFDNKPAAKEIIDSLERLDATIFDATLKDTATVKLMLLLSWVNKGTSLTLNPLTNGLPTDNKGILTTKTDALADSALSMAVVNKKIELYESMLKPSGQNCCKTPNYASQLKSYNQLLQLQKAITRTQATLTKDIAELKDQQAKSDKNQTDYKKSILSDSLFYSGYLNVSVFSDDINHPGYHYMRHHDELNDYRHFDNEMQKEINERQYIEAIADNHDPKSKLLVKYTFTDAGTDVDFLGTSLPAVVNGAPGGSKTLEDIFKVYSRINTIFTPYGNGVIALPLTPVRDATPDYTSKTNNVPDADKIPAKGSYIFIDSTSAKNLNSQGATFSFRVNKLYSFRLKAGIAFSMLERKTYTINQTANTATYTTNYAGMAPSFGIQVFTKPIDIQSSKAFPVGGHPFFYLGYIFNDAPVNNFLLGGGWEILSGFAITAGCHLGKSQKLFTDQGVLQTKDRYTGAFFVSASFGLEAFKAIFNSAKNVTNPFVK